MLVSVAAMREERKLWRVALCYECCPLIILTYLENKASVIEKA